MMLRETLARALHASRWPTITWDRDPTAVHDLCCRDVDALLAAAEEQGFVLVPMQATDAMLSAGITPLPFGVYTHATIQSAWEAMLLARPARAQLPSSEE